MIFLRSVFRELSFTVIGVCLALLALLTTMQLAKLLGNPATGALPIDGVATLLGFNLARYFPIVMVLALFIATLSVLVRSYKDHEMQVWLASGLGLAHWYRPVLALVLPVCAGLAVYTLTLLPHIESLRQQYQSSLKQRNDLGMVSPGLFMEPSSGKQIFFVEQLSPDTRQAQNVFVHSQSHGRDTVIQAANAEQMTGDGEQKQIQLNHGIRYEYQPNSEIRRLMSFASLRLWLPETPEKADTGNWRTATPATLLASGDREALSELAWRLGWPLSGIIVCLIAVPLANHHARGGRSYSLAVAVLIFLVYHNGMGLMEKQIERGHLDLVSAMLLSHVPALLAAGVLLAWRYGWRPLRRRA